MWISDSKIIISALLLQLSNTNWITIVFFFPALSNIQLCVCCTCAGTLWAMLILSALPQHKCSTMCPIQCYCDGSGAVKCVGYITDIPPHLPTSTFLLILDQTKMNVINERSLANQDLLLRFSLTNSHLHTIHPRAFYNAPQLKSVKLSSNDLSVFPVGVFTPLTVLDQLQLDGNKLETLAPDMLEGLGGLRELDLSKNKLDNLPTDLFDGLTKLVFLNLGRNNIKRLSPTIFHSLTELERLLIYNNEIEELEAGIFDRLYNLTELKLHSNNIRSLPPRMFWSLGNLKTLTLSTNQLKTIPEKSFYHMPKLEKLTLYKNPLIFLPDQLMGYVPGITEFYLYETNLTTVPGNLFANMSGLLSLNLHINEHLSELPHDLFCCLPRLNKLSLKSNNLLYLHPGLFSGLATLTLLFLNENKLQSLPEDIFLDLGNVSTLDLRRNNFHTLPGNIFSSNTVLTSLTLSANPWNCTCAIRDIAKWIKRNAHVIPDREDIICHSPEYQMLRPLHSLSDEDIGLCDAHSTTYFPTGNPQHETTSYKPAFTISTRAQRTVAAPTASPTTTASATTQGTTQQVTSTRADPTSRASILRTTPVPSPLPTPTTGQTKPTQIPKTRSSTASPDVYVFEDGPKYVHHNLLKGWVYVWSLPSDTVRFGIHMFCQVVLILVGLVLILPIMCALHRLNKTMIKLSSHIGYQPIEDWKMLQIY